MNDQAKQPALPEGAVPIDSIPAFANLIIAWHNNSMAQLAQMLAVPDGQSVTIQLSPDVEAEDIILTGDMLKGFRTAMVVAMNVFNELPFGGIAEPEDGAANDGHPAA